MGDVFGVLGKVLGTPGLGSTYYIYSRLLVRKDDIMLKSPRDIQQLSQQGEDLLKL